jgi:hypothetical protein
MIELNVKALKEYAEYLVEQDEALMALKILDMVPGYYRDHYPEELFHLRAFILSALPTPNDLLDDRREYVKRPEESAKLLKYTARGRLIKAKLYDANKAGIKPLIVDVGPGDYSIPISLKEDFDFKFSYYPIGLNEKAKFQAGDRLEIVSKFSREDKSERWFVAYEIIEHLFDTSYLATMFLRHGPFDKIFLSTPCYTFMDGSTKWKEEGIHHLRTFTPKEFIDEAIKLFKVYEWKYLNDPVMCLLWEKNGQV